MLLISGIINTCDNDPQQSNLSRVPIFPNLNQEENPISDSQIKVRTIGIPSHLFTTNQTTNHPVCTYKGQVYVITNILTIKKENSQNVTSETSGFTVPKPKLKISSSSSTDEECLQQ